MSIAILHESIAFHNSLTTQHHKMAEDFLDRLAQTLEDVKLVLRAGDTFLKEGGPSDSQNFLVLCLNFTVFHLVFSDNI